MRSSRRILVVDDSPDTLEVLERNLTSHGFEVATAPGVREALVTLEAQAADLVITDLKMPKQSGLDLVRHVVANWPDTAVLMMTGYPSVGGAVQAVKAGAEDFLPKPFTGDELLVAVKGAFAKLDARRAVERGSLPLTPGLIGESAVMRAVARQVARAVDGVGPVAILGEAGTGKQWVARTLHYSGPRAARPFVPACLAAIPLERAQAELFGGPGALARAARGGTLYLEDLHRAPAAVLAEVAKLCARADAKGARLVLSTGERLPDDPFFRSLSPLVIELPPLRARRDDLLLFVRYFAAQAAGAGREACRFSDRALEALRGYGWPGNVRELKSVVERLAAAGATKVVDVPDLPAMFRFSALPRGETRGTLADVESDYIEQVMATTQGNRTRAAEILGIDRKTLREKLRRAGLADDPAEGP